MSDETTTPAPSTPAASLLFQAPAFQEPTFQAPPERPSDQDEAPARRSRSRRSAAEDDSSPETASERRTRGRKQRATQDEAASSEADQSGAGAPRSKRTRARKAQVGDGDETAEVPPSSESPEEDDPAPSTRGRRARTRTAKTVEVEEEQRDEPTDTADESAKDEAEEEGTSRRRRRRRSRPTMDEDADPVDQVKALKGSTRLEAKKQRRREGRKEGRRKHGISESEFLARRESVNRRMVIRHRDGLDQIAILEDNLLVEHYVARRTQSSMVGNIYMGRVQNVLPSMEAAFVDIGRGRNAVLYAGEVNWDAVGLEGRPRRIESALKSGDPVPVQVTKDPIGHKGARLTSQITLAGRYLVLIPGGSMMGISRKLPDKERSRLKKILKAVVPEDAGVIVRTAAEGATEQQISEDVARLTKQWEEIEAKRAKSKSAPYLLRGEPELAVRVVRDIFNEDFSSLVIEGRQTYRTVKDYVTELSPELSERVEQWVGTEDVFAANRVDEQLAKGMDRKVWLPSGGTLVIDRTEAMTVIDVNTGKFIGAGGTLEETVTRNNLEAAEEIVRQLRLRDIGGIVIVDFVDMVLESNRDLVLRRLVECLGRDRTRHQVTEITSLGLVQMTRKRVGEGLVEAFSTTCQACEGRGFIVHHHPVENSAGGQGSQQGSGKSSKKKKSQAEPRRIEDGPEREKAREALTAIAAAAASSHAPKEGDSPGSGQGATEAPLAPKERGRGRTRQARSLDVVTPTRTTLEDVEVSIPRPVAPEVLSVESSTEVVPELPVSADLSVKKPRRRRAVSSQSAEPEPTVAPLIELPAKVEAPAPSPVPLDVSEIVLPERSEAPAVSEPAGKPKRRRRAVSTGVVDTGE
ncbi:Rne/Rng family ribonuclease [Schaalia sp. 19OD2882]|uniref:Rne/Rng family ribonuclease n=1 Tax=Schaalia sp. 19OD2882 TaxID=2794089 RepID=UPI0020A739AD|nr:Rne/Rng family ribonuclease [Schaalia sp. 19OD2882]